MISWSAGLAGLRATMECAAARRNTETLLRPTQSTQNVPIEYSVHTLPRSFKTDLRSVFPSHPITRTSDILLIPTMQRSCVELLEYGDAQAKEKDRLLEAFFAWSALVRGAIQRRAPGAWVDCTDPASGVARWGASGSVYPEVDGFSRILRYGTMDVGGCRILRHPVWGFACYPASLFTNAGVDVVRDALREVSGS